MSTITKTSKAMQARSQALAHIEQAQNLLREAVQVTSPLQGWANEKPKGPYYLIRDHAEATNALWHRVNNAPAPTGHDYE